MNSKDQFITSYNIARKCDVIFSEIVTTDQFSEISRNIDYKILSENENFIFYQNNKLELFDNAVIFSNTMMIENLFFYLKNIKNIKNINLITHQTDLSINKKQFNNRPKCIDFWYTPNLNYKHQNLRPIPLGLANDYSKKNLTLDHITNKLNIKDNKDKLRKIYVNFVPNTNEKKRNNLIEILKNRKDVTFDLPNLSLDEYRDKIFNHKYVLCPPGNGIDTHRLWETLYLGSTPVVEKIAGYEKYLELPIIFYENFNEINIKLLEEKYSSIKNMSNDFLNIDYWMTIVKNNQNMINKSKKTTIITNAKIDFLYHKKNRFKRFIESKIKKMTYLIKKINIKISNA